MPERGLVIVYTGKGKGKTTAALGIVLRAVGHGYKVGMIRILELRELAKRELGAKFDLRAYHDLVLKNGALPMSLLEENVRAWIAARKG